MNFLPVHWLTELQDWQKFPQRGRFFGAQLAEAKDDTLLPFTTMEKSTITGGSSVSSFKLRKLDENAMRRSTITVLSTITLSTGTLTKKTGTSYDYFYYLATTSISGLTNGVFQYYIQLSSGEEILSEPFYYNTAENFTQAGDFNNDFNNDFFTYIT